MILLTCVNGEITGETEPAEVYNLAANFVGVSLNNRLQQQK